MAEVYQAYLACGLYYKKYGVLKTVSTSPARKPTRRKKSRETVVREEEEDVGIPSSPPQRTYEPMSEIDHPLLSEGICLPRMGYLRGGESGDEDIGKENVEPEDEMERFFSDVLA
jgi:hypothetical protein